VTDIVKINKQFFIPLRIERAFNVYNDNIIAYWVYWTPDGDECMVGAINKDGLITEYDSDWVAFLELEKINPIMQHYNLGSSDRYAEYVFFVDKIHNKFYFVKRDVNISTLFSLIGLKTKRGFDRWRKRWSNSE